MLTREEAINILKKLIHDVAAYPLFLAPALKVIDFIEQNPAEQPKELEIRNCKICKTPPDFYFDVSVGCFTFECKKCEFTMRSALTYKNSDGKKLTLEQLEFAKKLIIIPWNEYFAEDVC